MRVLIEGMEKVQSKTITSGNKKAMLINESKYAKKKTMKDLQ